MTPLETTHPRHSRRLPVGAETLPDGGVSFRLWAPTTAQVTLELSATGTFPLMPEGGGYHSTFLSAAKPGMRYRFLLDDEGPYPDPASRFQPEGPHGPSEIVASTFAWSDAVWPGPGLPGQVIAEIHLGTFTEEGTWRAATEKLAHMADMGISIIEVMPVAEFAGKFGWGYDGVNLFAPSRLYGTPDDMKAFIDRAHGLGIGVLLDVVYNHLGPSGNYLGCFSPDYFTDRYKNEWGQPLNFDGPASAPVRQFILANVQYWIEEFHLDGLRVDATQSMFDSSSQHILTEITEVARKAARGRQLLIIAENELQQANLLDSPAAGGSGLDALWNDDFHHSAMVAATGRREAYFVDHHGTPQEFISAAKSGFLFQGQFYAWQGKRRGVPTGGRPRMHMVNYLENHDQVANSGRGERLHMITSPGRWRTLTALLLLLPSTPMLFQGQEFAASAPFLYFADHEPELAQAVRLGRLDFLAQFPSLATPEMTAQLSDPGAHETFRSCKLDWSQRATQSAALALHRDLIALRRADPVIAAQGAGGFDGAVLGQEAFCLRWFGPSADDRLLLVNLGPAIDRPSFPEPLLAPANGGWRVIFSTETPRYGGLGTSPPDTAEGWRLPAQSALMLAPSQGVGWT